MTQSSPSAASQTSPISARNRALAINALRVLFLVAILLGWQFASGRLVSEFFVSKPSAIIATLLEWISDGSLFFHAAITATEAFAGFALGSFAGIVAGTLLGRAQLLAEIVEPFIMAFYSLPKVALAPLFVLWFGIGIEMKIVLTAAVVFFLVFLNTYTGVRSVSRELVTILRLMGASERHVLTKVVIPSAITWVFAGLRISVPYALIGAIVGELVASNRGLGFLLSSSAGQFQTAGVFAALVAIVALAFILNLAVKFAEKRLMVWKETDNRGEVTV
jgi:NitT/TauT family transport system permease protein